MEKSNFSFEEVDRIVEEYYKKGREKWTDEQLAEHRAELSVILYKISRLDGPTYYKEKANWEIDLFKVEGRVRQQAETEYIQNGYSKSMAIDKARKAINTDTDYIGTWKKSEEASQQLALYKEWMSQGNQILNSMAKKT